MTRFIFVALLVLTGCDGSNSGGGGTTDVGGGGEILGSTEEQVIRAVLNVKRFYMSVPGQRFVGDYLTEFAQSSSNDPELVDALRKIARPVNFNEPRYSNIASYLAGSRVVYRYSSKILRGCPNDVHLGADAFVASNSYEAQVCFDISALKRVPPSDLFDHLLLLWLHEIAHLNGFGESLALRIVILAEKFVETSSDSSAVLIEVLNSTLESITANLKAVLAKLEQKPDDLPQMVKPEDMLELRDSLVQAELCLQLLQRLEFHYLLSGRAIDLGKEVAALENHLNITGHFLRRGDTTEQTEEWLLTSMTCLHGQAQDVFNLLNGNASAPVHRPECSDD